jgi:hypothetical protein
MGLGMLLADFYIKRNGNPFKQQQNESLSLQAENPYTTDSSSVLGDSSTSPLTASGANAPSTLEEATNMAASKTETSQKSSRDADVTSTESTERKVKEVSHEEAEESGRSGSTYVVTGVFGKEVNAKAMIKKLKNFGYSHAFGFPRKKLTAVTAGTFSEKEAREVKSRLENKGLDAVVMEK